MSRLGGYDSSWSFEVFFGTFGYNTFQKLRFIVLDEVDLLLTQLLFSAMFPTSSKHWQKISYITCSWTLVELAKASTKHYTQWMEILVEEIDPVGAIIFLLPQYSLWTIIKTLRKRNVNEIYVISSTKRVNFWFVPRLVSEAWTCLTFYTLSTTTCPIISRNAYSVSAALEESEIRARPTVCTIQNT